LTENVNQLAGNLTTQVRAIAEVSTAVTQGDLTRSIKVEAQGEVAELKDNINQMIANLRETTQRNAEQDWLKTSLARISGMLQGQRDLATVTQLLMSEVTPTVNAQHGAFFLAEPGQGGTTELKLAASYGYTPQRGGMPSTFHIGEGLVGQAAFERKTIALADAPPGYIKVGSGLGDAAAAGVLVMPVLFEDQVLGVIELASIRPFSEVNRDFLDQLTETIGVVLNTIRANMRTEELLAQSQGLTQELQKQSEELRETNDELQEKARLLSEQNRDIEIKNEEIELARRGLEDKAAQLALSSKYKSEFLANMSHELRTPLNSMLILSRLLAENEDGKLDPRQVDFAQTIHGAGNDLLSLINDILDLSKVEAGRMELDRSPIALADICEDAERAFRPVAEQNRLEFRVELDEQLPAAIVSDDQRLKQILKNLLSNAFKFTHEGGVTLSIGFAPSSRSFGAESLVAAEHVISFAQVRRHRFGALDLQGNRATARRRAPGRVLARPWQHLLPVPAAGRAGRRARSGRAESRPGGPRCGHQRTRRRSAGRRRPRHSRRRSQPARPRRSGDPDDRLEGRPRPPAARHAPQARPEGNHRAPADRWAGARARASPGRRVARRGPPARRARARPAQEASRDAAPPGRRDG
jgi:signal transduction histidine kinase/HAMP domain-containing protein